MTTQSMDDEDQLAAYALSGNLTSAMLHAHDEKRTWLFGWERDGLRWLIWFVDRRPDGLMDSAWMRPFLDLNREAILSDRGRMNFNLRAARLAKEAGDD
jgi:hypothetical protein